MHEEGLERFEQLILSQMVSLENNEENLLDNE